MIKLFKTIKARYVRKGSFLANVLTLMTGTTISQLILIAISPILTRLYTPQDFGIYALYIAITLLIAIISTGKYEFAIMLPEKDEEAINVAGLAVIIALGISGLTFLIVFLFNTRIISFLGDERIYNWLYFIPLSVFLSAVYQILNFWLNRNKQYSKLALCIVIQQVVQAIVSIVVGINKLTNNGLIFSAIISQTIAYGTLGWQVWKEDGKKFQHINIRRFFLCGIKYKKFPIYNMPYYLINAFSSRFIILAFTAFKYSHYAGLFSFSRNALFALITSLSSSIDQVFSREASILIKTPRLEQLVSKLMFKIAELTTPILIFFIFWAQDIFKLVFGAKWQEAGIYAAIISPVLFCFLFTGWSARIYEVTQKQQLAFFIQLISDSILVASTWFLLKSGTKPLNCILVYSFSSCICNAVHLYIIFKIANFNVSIMTQLIKNILTLSFFSIVMMLLINAFPFSQIYRFLIGAGGLFVYYNTIWVYKYLKRNI